MGMSPCLQTWSLACRYAETCYDQFATAQQSHPPTCLSAKCDLMLKSGCVGVACTQ
jgi:hypothetical protein